MKSKDIQFHGGFVSSLGGWQSIQVIFWVLIVFRAEVSLGGWSNRPQVGLGVTDNAYLSDSNPVADSFLVVGDSTKFSETDRSYEFWFKYSGYSTVHENDSLSWMLGRYRSNSSCFGPNWDCDLLLGGQHFAEANPATTEEAFDHIYLDGNISKNSEGVLSGDFLVMLGYQLKYYTILSGRLDNKTYLNLDFSKELNKLFELQPFTEVGFIFSNQSYFSGRYLQIGTKLIGKFWSESKMVFSYFFESMVYPYRDVSIVTDVGQKRGKSPTTIVYQNEYEVQNMQLFGLALENEFIWGRLETSATYKSHTSGSGYADYNEMVLKTMVTFKL